MEKQAMETAIESPLSSEADPREGLPSASINNLIMRCPGAWSLMDFAPEYEDEEAGIRGTRIHACLEGKRAIETMPLADRITTLKIMSDEAALVESLNFEGARHVREQRFWIVNDKLKKITSCRPDIVMIEADRAMVINYKTGYADQTPIDENWQVLTEVIAVYDNFESLMEVTGVLLHPNCGFYTGEKLTMQYQTWTAAQIESAREILIKGVEMALSDNAARISGPQCGYCPCRGICPEAHAALAKAADGSVALEKLSPEAVDKWIEMSKVAIKTIEGIKARIGQIMMYKPEYSATYEMRSVRSTREFADPMAAVTALGKWLDEGEMKQALAETASLSQIEELIANKLDTTKEGARHLIADHLGGLIVSVPVKPSIFKKEKRNRVKLSAPRGNYPIITDVPAD
jgi:hypothetical protein